MPPTKKSSNRPSALEEHGGGSSRVIRIVFSPVSIGVRLPTVFMENHGQSLDDGTMVTLKDPYGASWSVRLRRTDTGLWLGRGWEEFADYYEIEVRYFLLFKYQGRAQFSVSIMDRTGSEIDYPMEDDEGEDDEEEMEDFDANPGRIDTVRGGEKERFDSFRRAMCFESENPFFLTFIQPSYVRDKYMMSLASQDVRDFLPSDNNPCTLQLSVPGNNKVWTLYSNVYREGLKTNVHRGWKEFALDNKLRVGDVCVFELVSPADLRFEITNFRNT